jgi:hypothetical protein
VIRGGAAAAAISGVLYLPHVLAVGAKVLGYLPAYLREEHYSGGGRFLVAGALHIPAYLAGVVSVGAVITTMVWVFMRRPPAPVGIAALFGALLLATSPVQPWYATTLLAVAALAGRPRYAAVVLAGYPYFFAVILASPHAAVIGEAGYSLGAVAVLTAQASQRSRATISGGTSSERVTPPLFGRVPRVTVAVGDHE